MNLNGKSCIGGLVLIADFSDCGMPQLNIESTKVVSGEGRTKMITDFQFDDLREDYEDLLHLISEYLSLEVFYPQDLEGFVPDDKITEMFEQATSRQIEVRNQLCQIINNFFEP